MSRMRSLAVFLSLGPSAILSGCGGLFESKLSAPQAYVLRLPAGAPTSIPAAVVPAAGTLRVQRPEAGPGLNTDRIALIRSEGRFDVYAASRWAAPAPDLLESVLVDSLRQAGHFSTVLDDAAPFAPDYDLRVTIRRFEADYTGGGGPPTVHVVLDCTLGRSRDRRLLSNFTVQGSVRAAEDRLGAVVAAFESATGSAVAELLIASQAAIRSQTAAASEGR
jgi:cholesterol transport system auxiliary component